MQRTTFVFLFLLGIGTILSACDSNTPQSPPTVAQKNTEVAEETIVSAETKIKPATPAPKKETPKKVEKPAEEKPAIKETVPEVKETVKTPVEITEKGTPTEEEATSVFTHDTWNNLLQRYVTADGRVNYQGFQSSAAEFESYLNDLANNPPNAKWSREKAMAYWINAYNAFTVKLIVDYYPVKSIKNIHNGNPWDVKWIEIGGKTYTLNNIENDIIRPTYKDARIHFAVNCAAASCPPLLNKAYTEDNLNALLEQQTKKFINNPKYNTISPNSVQVSRIFEWYASDFDDLIAYLNKYSKTQINKDATVSYKEYDWKLNN